MLKYNTKIAFRNLVNRKRYTLINVLGLAIGLASFIVIALYIIDELGYDLHHSKSERIFRIVNVYDFEGVGEESSSSPFPVGPTLLMEYPHLIETSVRFFNNWSSSYFVEYGEKRFNERKLFFVDSTVFDVFDIPFIAGTPASALNRPGTVVITESTSRRYFGDEDPIGKKLEVEEHFNVIVTGVIRDPVPQSHFTYELLVSMETVKTLLYGYEPKTWVWNPCWTYIVLKDGVDAEDINKLFDQFIYKYFYDAEKDNITLTLQPLPDIHLRSSLDYEIEPNGNIMYIRILSVIAIFMLIIATINFVNLSTATAGRRAREIGMKKVVGATRRQLAVQFITESVVVSILGLLIALALVEFIIPYFNDFTGKNISSSYYLEPVKMFLLLAIAFATGILSGIYPAFYLSSFKPIAALKGELVQSRGGVKARKILVVTQFSISIILIVTTIVTFQQVQFFQNKDLRFTKENIIILPIQHTPVVQHYDAFKSELLMSPEILYVTSLDYIVGVEHNTHEFRPEGFPEDQWQFYPALMVRDDFLETFDIEVVAGRGFEKESKTDPSEAVMINEAMVKFLGWKSNENAIGKRFHSFSGKENVIGVFKDFHVNSLHAGITPMVLNIPQNRKNLEHYSVYLAIRHMPGQFNNALTLVQKAWGKFAPQRPFEYKIHAEELARMYREEYILSRLAAIFTFLIIFIASLGLYGLVSYLIDQRTKEIGIRMVLGASLFRIIKLLSREFSLLILIANIIAWPVAFLLMYYWLQNFEFQVPIRLIVFVIAGLMSYSIAMTITALKVMSSFRMKPSETLNHE